MHNPIPSTSTEHKLVYRKAKNNQYENWKEKSLRFSTGVEYQLTFPCHL